jgi:nucleoside-diphosphate-sugar epimerase
MFGTKVLVRGSLGFIGQHVTQALVRVGANVSVLCRSETAAIHKAQMDWADDVRWFLTPADQPATRIYEAAVSEADFVVDLGGVSGAVDSNRNAAASLDGNCRDALLFFGACARSGRKPRVFFASSRLVYGTPTYLPVSEKAPVQPASMYAAHKLCVEHYLQVHGHLGHLT